MFLGVNWYKHCRVVCRFEVDFLKVARNAFKTIKSIPAMPE
jgi:hypothetical protein